MSEEDAIPETGAVFTYGKSCFADNVPSHFFIRNDPVIEVSCGEEHSGIVCKNGRVFCFGKNSFGQLGLGHTENVYKPNCVKSLKPEKVKHIACGRSHTIVSTESGTVYGFGDNSDGQLGKTADILYSDVPVEITKFDQQIVRIATGSYHTAVLIENGDVYVWGSNSDGQLGLDRTDDSRVNVRVVTIVSIDRPVVCVSCGHGHTAFVTDNGDLYTCGDREYGKLGHDQWTLSRVDTTEKFVQVACGANHTVALNDGGKVFVCGNNDCGQIGLRSVTSQGHLYPCPVANERIVQITCGESHSAFVTASGKLFTCGDGKYGKLCIDVNQITTPTLVSAFVDKQLNVQTVSCGGNHTLIRAEPIVNELAVNNSVQQIKPSDTLPPLRVAKKVIEERKENIEPFASVASENGNDREILNGVNDNDIKKIDAIIIIDRQIQMDKNSYGNNAAEKINNTKIVNDKLLEREESNSSNSNMMSMKDSNEKIEKKIEKKSKYPKNERVRSRLCIVI